MNRIALAACLLLLSIAAQGEVSTEIQVMIFLDGGGIESITSAEFRIEGLPYEQAEIWEYWYSPLTIGKLDSGFAIAFIEPVPGPVVHLGSLTFIAHEDVGEDYEIWVRETLITGHLLITDGDYLTYPIGGGRHVFNCSGQYDCPCYYGNGYGVIQLSADPEDWQWGCDQNLPLSTSVPLEPEADLPTSWGLLKQLY